MLMAAAQQIIQQMVGGTVFTPIQRKIEISQNLGYSGRVQAAGLA